MNNETATIKDLSNINSTKPDDVNHKSKESNATVDKTDQGYFAQLKDTLDNISNTALKSFKKFNELGVKAPITLNLTELNKDIEYDQEDNEHIRKIRSTDKVPFITSEYESKIFSPTPEDKEFIRNEKALLDNKTHPILDTYGGVYYKFSVNVINAIYSKVTLPNKESRFTIFEYIDSLGGGIFPFIMQMRQYFLVVKDNQGQIGVPTLAGIKFLPPPYQPLDYTSLENIDNCTRTIDIGLDIIDKLQENYQELFKDTFKQDIMVKGTPEIEHQKLMLSFILSYLKPLNSDMEKDLDRLFSNYSFLDQKKMEHFAIFREIFYSKEDAKKCLISMNKAFLSEHLNNFDLYKYFESIYPKLRRLHENYQLIHDTLLPTFFVKENPIVTQFSYLDDNFYGNLYLNWSKYHGEACPEIKKLTMQTYLNTTQVGEVINNGTIGSYRNNSQTVDAMNNRTINATQLAGGIGAFGVFVATLGFLGKYLHGKYYGNNQAITDEEIGLKEEGNDNLNLSAITPNPNGALLLKDRKKGETNFIQATSNQNHLSFSL